MPSIKDYNVKLASLKNTQKITKTMKMVSASKLRRAHEAQKNAKEYEGKLNLLIAGLLATLQGDSHPLLCPRPKVKKTLVLVFTSDRGLCGGFNNNLCRHVYNWILDKQRETQQVEVSCCGQRGHTFFRNRATVKSNYEDVTAKPKFYKAVEIGKKLVSCFMAHEYDEVYLARNIFKSALSQNPDIKKLLPVVSDEIEHGEALPSQYIFEPMEKDLLEMLIPRTVYFRIYYSLLENSAGEHGARMTAMDNATNNANELIDKNTLIRNRARQAAITTELTEIVAGAEAL
jgi:F-type H+-transporting ATPase subunit gamma